MANSSKRRSRRTMIMGAAAMAVGVAVMIPTAQCFIQRSPIMRHREQRTWCKACCQLGGGSMGGHFVHQKHLNGLRESSSTATSYRTPTTSAAVGLNMMINNNRSPEEEPIWVKALKGGVDAVANVVKGGVELVGNVANAIVNVVAGEDEEEEQNANYPTSDRWAELIAKERERQKGRDTRAGRERKMTTPRRREENEIGGLMNSLFDDNSFGMLGRGLVGGLGSAIGSSFADTRSDIEDIIAITAKTLNSDAGAINALGGDIKVGQPFSQSYSSSSVNGVSTKSVSLQFQAAGNKAAGVVSVRANIDAFGRISLQQVDLQGTGGGNQRSAVNSKRRSASSSSSGSTSSSSSSSSSYSSSSSSSSSDSSWVPPSERKSSRASSRVSPRASSPRSSSSSSSSSVRSDSSEEVIDVDYVDLNN